MKQYKIVITIEFEDGHEEFVVWEPELLGAMLYGGIDLYEFFYDPKKNNLTQQPVLVKLELFDDPIIKNIQVKIGDVLVNRQILIGTKILPIKTL